MKLVTAAPLKTVWTKEYIDPQAKICMVSAVTPVYDGDRFLGVVGHDIALQDLVRRTVEDKLEGAYNVLLRRDGHLIAHPTLAASIEAAGGSFDVGKSGDPKLQALHRRATGVSESVALVESEDGDDYLAVARVARGACSRALARAWRRRWRSWAFISAP